jgi:hypothetical protein
MVGMYREFLASENATTKDHRQGHEPRVLLRNVIALACRGVTQIVSPVASGEKGIHRLA